MRYGFVKVCSATVKIRVADVEFNTEEIIKAIKESSDRGSALTVFPELCVCGYTCGDLFNQSALLTAVRTALEKIRKATEKNDTLVFVGAPLENYGRLYNCAVAFCGGKILGVVPKTYLPNYGEFYERRHFSPAPALDAVGFITIGEEEVPFGTDIIFRSENEPDFTVAAELCEDLWSPEPPSIRHAKAGANVIVNLSCSDETVGKSEYRRDLVKVQSGKLVAGYVYSDAGDGESTTDLVFAGHDIIAENGVVLGESKLFENGLVYGEIDVEMLSAERRRLASGYFRDGEDCVDGNYGSYRIVTFRSADNDSRLERSFSKTPFVPDDGAKLAERLELILSLQSKGLQKRLEHTNSKTVVLGISGGLDSSLALLVTVRAFKALDKDLKDIIAVTMPGFGTTKKTKGNAVKLIENLGATARTIPISATVLKHFKDIGHDPENHDVTYENAQARMRTMVLMDIANQSNGLVIGTGDLSEFALGWATYNGDHMSMYGVNSSVPKTLVKYLVGYEAEKLGGECGKILNDILAQEITPELLPPDKNGQISQITEDIVGPYVLHDFFLYYAIRRGYSPDKVQFLAELTFKGEYGKETIVKWLKSFYARFFKHQFKRSCVPDGVKVGSVALSPRGDWRMPSDAKAAIWLGEIK